MDYIKVVNSNYLNFSVAIILLLVIAVCIIFLKRSWKEALDLGITQEELKKIVINSIGISLIPSIPIVLSVIVMVPVLGVALPWLRTSVIGSSSTELIAATMAVEATGVEFTATDMTLQSYVNAAWAMTLGCSVALPMALIVLKPVCITYETFKQKDSKWIDIFSLCALITVITAFSISHASKGVIQNIVILSCFAFSYLCTVLAKNGKLKWVKDFSFPLTILFGLIISMVISPLL